MKFSDIKFEQLDSFPFGIYSRIEFENGYTASVIQNYISYGRNDGLYEIAVMVGDNIVYDTPVTNDVLGWLSESDVEMTLKQISELPVRETLH